jgi:hypothetical protein
MPWDRVERVERRGFEDEDTPISSSDNSSVVAERLTISAFRLF